MEIKQQKKNKYRCNKVQNWTEDEEVRGGEQMSLLDIQVRTKNKTEVGSLPFFQGLAIHSGVLALRLSPSPRSAGRFSLISPQSLELDTGVNHHSLDLLFYRSSPHLISRCIFRIPTPPSPHNPTARLRPGSHPACSPPPHF